MYTIFAVTILKLVWVVGFEPTSSHFQGEPSGQADNIPSLFGAVDGNRTRLNRIDNPVLCPENYHGMFGAPLRNRTPF